MPASTTRRRIPLTDRKQEALFAILLVLLVCYTTFLTADVFTGDHNNTWSWIVKHLAGILCFVLTLLIGQHCHDTRDRRLIQLALGLAVVADFFMGFDMRLPGTAVFVLVQITLIVRHARHFVWNRKEVLLALAVYVPIGFAFWYLSDAMKEAGLLLPALIYTSLLATSVWMGIGTIVRRFYVPTMARIVAVAVVAFFLCDLSLGLLDDKPRKRGVDSVQWAAGIEASARFESASKQEAAQMAETTAIEPTGLDVAAGPEAGVAAGFREAAGAFEEIRRKAAERLEGSIPNPVVTGVGILIWFFYLPALTLLAMSGFRLEYLRSILPVIPVRT